jgi:hypothetical protein
MGSQMPKSKYQMMDALHAVIDGMLVSLSRLNRNGCKPSFGIWILIFVIHCRS